MSQMAQEVTRQIERAVLPPNPTPTPAHSAPIAPAQIAQDSILAAVRAGRKTPDAIATATRLGVTATYQELDGMVKAGALTMARDGTYSPSAEGTRR